MPTRSTPFTATDDITFELLILEQIASHRRPLWSPTLPTPYAAKLHESDLWDVPVDVSVPVSRADAWKAAALAALIALAPLAWLPARAETEMRVGLSVIDARTGRPLSGAQILNERGHVVGSTDGNGKATLSVPAGAADRFVIEHQGYRSFPIVRTQLRDQNLVAMLPVPASTHPVAQATKAPAAKPTHHPTPAPTVKPTHRPVAKPAVRPTARPIAHPVVKPTTHPAIAPSPKASLSPEFGAVPTHLGTYTVQHGDTLWSIARREYGDPNRWRGIFAANRREIRHAGLIHPGMILKLPKSLRHVAPGGVVMVHRGDSLWVLAERYLGDGNRWPELYEANRSHIHNPRVIQPGQRLRLPPRARHSRTIKRRKR